MNKLFGTLYRIVRNKMVNIIFLLILICFFVVNGMLVDYYFKLQLINSYNNTPYNAYARGFAMISKNDVYADLTGIQDENILDECVLFKNNPVTNGEYEVIYCAENAVAMTSCNESDWNWNSAKPLAVAGSDAGYNVGDSFYRNGVEYLICGKLEAHISEAINYGVFYTNNNLAKVDLEAIYIISSKDAGGVEKSYDKLVEMLREEDISVKEIKLREAEFKDYIKYDKMFWMVIVCLGGFYMLVIFVATKVWMKLKAPEMYVRNLLGEEYVKLKVYGEYVGMGLLAGGIWWMLVRV